MLTGPAGAAFSPPREVNPDAAGAILVGGGIGLAPLAIWRRELAGAGIPERSLLGFRDRDHSGGLELFRCSEVRLASEDGHAGHRGYVTDLLAVMLEGDAAATAAVYACGPPGMLEAVRALCAERGVEVELAMESPMACGYGACFGCVVPLRDGGYMRLCVDGPVVARLELETALVSAGAGSRDVTVTPGPSTSAASQLAHPVLNASGTFDAIAARRAFGDELLERFPVRRLRLQDDHPAAARGQPAAAALGEAGRAWSTRSGCPTRAWRASSQHDLPLLAELPVPLIVSVMGTSAEEFAALVAAVAAREEVAAIELNVSCPNVHSGLIVGEQPAESRGADGGAATADRQAADREADAERRRSGRRRGRRRRGAGPTPSR